MKRFLPILLIFSFVTNSKASDEVLFTVGGKPVTQSEFEYIYTKNNFNNQANYSKQSLDDYLNLYINFRLKVEEALALGLDKDEKLNAELNTYEKQLLNAYIDKEVLDKVLQTEYDRSKQDVNISHIFIASNQGDDDEIAEQKIKNIYQTLQKGNINFEDLVYMSDDKASAAKNGNLGWYNSYQIIYPEIENAVYSLKKGEISQPIKTKLGYHILKLNDTRTALPKIKVAVIKKFKPLDGDSTRSKQVADDVQNIYNQLKKGADFTEMVNLYSEDELSKKNGGILPWFGINEFFSGFEDAAYSLKNIGDISKPIETKSAWYIIQKLDEQKPVGYNEAAITLKTKLLNSNQYDYALDQFLNKQKAENNLVIDNHNRVLFLQRLQDLAKTYPFKYQEKDNPLTVATIGNVDINENDLGKNIEKIYYSFNVDKNIDRNYALIDEAINMMVLENFKQNVKDNNTEFNQLMNEYKNGIMIFDLSEKNVWNVAASDSAGIENYYNTHLNEFTTPSTMDTRTFELSNKKVAKKIYKTIKLTPDIATNAVIDQAKVLGDKSVTVDKQVDEVDKNSPSVLYSSDGTKYFIVQECNFNESKVKPLDECRGFVIAAYQNQIEKDWINTLQTKFPVNINEKVLQKMIKN
ncbi:MAG: peptidylprolyl isomerase [Chitinophagales bacterium]|nr:peptidylprolyl isomerase [Chitinophagales bacterium]